MTRTVRDIAHARAGDKGDTSNVAVFANTPEDWPTLRRTLTAERVVNALAGLVHGPVRRYEVESLHALNFVMERALEGGVNASLNLDSHGKSWSFLLLALPLDENEGGRPDPD